VNLPDNPLERLQFAGDSGETPLEELQGSFDPQYLFSFGGTGLTQYIFWMIICVVLTAVVILVAAKKLQLIPTNKFANMVEYGYERISVNMGQNAIGKGYEKHMPLIATLFFFILISNFIGLIPGFKTPTGTLSVTWALSTVSFFYFNWQGIKARGGWGYVKSIAPAGLPGAMVPIIWFFELISLLLRWLTLAVRLYGNMFAGHMVLGIFALLTSVFIQCININMLFTLPPIVWMLLLIAMYALECLVAFLQAYVFAILTAVYIGLATSES
jgi:F-type H+-transporting ATPase subunit a